jgi:hypothetical protein
MGVLLMVADLRSRYERLSSLTARFGRRAFLHAFLSLLLTINLRFKGRWLTVHVGKFVISLEGWFAVNGAWEKLMSMGVDDMILAR